MGFHCSQSIKARYVVLEAPKDLIVRCLFKYKSEVNYFVFIGFLGILQGPAPTTIFCAIFVKVY